MSRRRRESSAAAPAVRVGVPMARRLLPLAPVEELDEQRMRTLFRRRALYVIGGAVAFAAVYALLSWLKYRAYMDARYDLGNMVQAVYNTAHGHFLEITSGDLKPRQMSRLGSHVDPILALFALPWLVWPSPTMLLVAQSAIVATGAWPAYRLGTRITRDPGAGALLAGAYLLYPALGFLVLNEFHPVALAAPLLLWAFLYMEEDRWVRAAVFLVLAGLCKEDVPLVIAFMGGYFAIRKRSLWPLVISVVGVAWFAIDVWAVIPHFNGNQSAFINRYGDYGDGAGAVAKSALTHPRQTLGDLTSASNLQYWLRLLWPLGFTSLLSPLTTLIALPEYGLNALSSIPFQRRIEFHYTALEIPFLYAAAVLGVMRLWRWLGGGFRKAEELMRGERVRRSTLALLVLLCALAGNYFLGPLPFSLPGAAYSGADYVKTSHDLALDEAVALIPKDAVVSANNNVGAQLAARRVAYIFPYFAKADWVVVDTRHPFFYDKENKQLHSLALGRLVADPDFRSVFAKDGVYVFKRVGASGSGAVRGAAASPGATPSPGASATP
ncbi:MAG TPA: DUF2079 domain-containing protein [Thermoleophilia bacterium]|nr:DUF2079 domain-containing protein [Thermoleophilia bacterium]